ncbi:hypothetical protein IQ264_19385 [Phormidium sp. LEGE 05292]|uniref:hypothetical protein n=1 Tax=[Phormidium] sp. LEGE 05292 TaxID=767427 RepID=UPI001881995A|nr:hypothetical protein [Phormidium sp. LEGE 05292]MBE9227595.1 hypothetical protein [Phormidium sp. LEGE 05292]
MRKNKVQVFLAFGVLATAAIVAQSELASSQAIFRRTFHESTTIQGSGRTRSGGLTFQYNISVSGGSSGNGSGTFSYKGEQDGLQMVARVECVGSFLLNNSIPVGTLAGPIIGGSSRMTATGKWLFVGIRDQNPDKIRVVDVSREEALKLCNQPTDSFPGTVTSGNVTISH